MSWQVADRPGYPGRPSNQPSAPQTPLRTHVSIAIGIGAIFALFVYVALAPASRALGAGLVLAIGSFGLLRAMDLVRLEWPTPPNGRAVRLAGIQRWRLNGFDALTDPRPGLSPDLRVRLRALATAILARHELTPGSPGAVSLLGASTHELLFRPDRVAADPPPPNPSRAQITALMDRLIELGDSRKRPAQSAQSAQPAPTASTAPSEQVVEMEGN